ncbi:uncharacterized protein LOC144587289 [Pogona vitticeps]
MPLDQARDYEAYRELVFSRFGINAEHLRWKFQALIKKLEESYSQLGANLVRYLEKWLEQAKVKTLEDMKNIIGLEQFYSVLLGELRYLVRDKKPKNVQETSETVDYITDIKNPKFSEVKFDGKSKDDRKSPGITSSTIRQLEATLEASSQSRANRNIRAMNGRGTSHHILNKESLKLAMGAVKKNILLPNARPQEIKIGQQKVGKSQPKKVYCREFTVFTDTTNIQLGAVLSQADDNGEQHPMTFLSKKLQAAWTVFHLWNPSYVDNCKAGGPKGRRQTTPSARPPALGALTEDPAERALALLLSLTHNARAHPPGTRAEGARKKRPHVPPAHSKPRYLRKQGAAPGAAAAAAAGLHLIPGAASQQGCCRCRISSPVRSSGPLRSSERRQSDDHLACVCPCVCPRVSSPSPSSGLSSRQLSPPLRPRPRATHARLTKETTHAQLGRRGLGWSYPRRAPARSLQRQPRAAHALPLRLTRSSRGCRAAKGAFSVTALPLPKPARLPLLAAPAVGSAAFLGSEEPYLLIWQLCSTFSRPTHTHTTAQQQRSDLGGGGGGSISIREFLSRSQICSRKELPAPPAPHRRGQRTAYARLGFSRGGKANPSDGPRSPPARLVSCDWDLAREAVRQTEAGGE